VIDALRADHVGYNGYYRDTTPELDRLAKSSVVFDAAYSAGTNTRASVPAFLTGLYPTATGVIRLDDALNPEVPTLPDELRRRGYATAAFVANPSLRPEVGLARSFDVYDHDPLLDEGVPRYRRFETATKLQERAQRFLSGIGDRPFFLYLHYRDVHAPYVPPPPYDRRYWPLPAADRANLRRLNGRELALLGDYNRLPGPPFLEYYLAQYDGEIRYTDDRIAEFLDELRQAGRLDNTILVVTADHGEGFLEHGAWDHGNDHFDEELHVPLFLRLPGGRGAGRHVSTAVSLVDLFPTLAALTGLEPPPDAQGRNLLPLVDGNGSWPERPLFAASDGGRYSVRLGGWKLIIGHRLPHPYLIDVANDPRETTDLFTRRPDKVEELRKVLTRHLRESKRLLARRPSGRTTIDDESESQLHALGYL